MTSNPPFPQTDELAAYDPAQLFDHALIACHLFHYTLVDSHPGLVRSPEGEITAPPDYTNDRAAFSTMLLAGHMHPYVPETAADRRGVTLLVAHALRDRIAQGW